MGKLGTLKIGKRTFIWQKLNKLGGKYVDKDTKISSDIVYSIFKDNKPVKLKPLTKKLMKGTGVTLNLFQTRGFKPFAGLMLLGMLATGAGGYLLGKKSNNSAQHAVNPIPEPETNSTSTPALAQVEEQEENMYFTKKVKKGGTWENIVKTHYPDLIEKCNGKIYGPDGAIRKLKNKLSECGDDLTNETDIPRTLNLPLEIDGARLDSTATVKPVEISSTGGHTQIAESGCRTTKNIFLVKDDKANQSYRGEDLNASLDSLKARTGVKEYQLNYVN